MPSRKTSRSGRRTSGRRPNIKTALKVTSKKGAYKPTQVKNMAARRAPMTEFKRRETYEIAVQNRVKTDIGLPVFAANYPDTTDPIEIANGSAFHFIKLESFYRNQRGLRDNQVIGSSLFSRYLNMKMRLDFPQGKDQIKNPVRIYLVHGIVKAPYNSNSLTPVETSAVTAALLQNHIETQIKEFWRDGEEDLRWNQNEETDNIKVLGKKLLKTKRMEQTTNFGPGNAQLATDGTSSTAPFLTLGGPQDITAGCSWRFFKKIHLADGTLTAPTPAYPQEENQYTPDEVDDANSFPNWLSWLPFCFLYMPDHDKMYKVNPASPLTSVGLETKLKLSYNDIHIYSDS